MPEGFRRSAGPSGHTPMETRERDGSYSNRTTALRPAARYRDDNLSSRSTLYRGARLSACELAQALPKPGSRAAELASGGTPIRRGSSIGAAFARRTKYTRDEAPTDYSRANFAILVQLRILSCQPPTCNIQRCIIKLLVTHMITSCDLCLSSCERRR